MSDDSAIIPFPTSHPKRLGSRGQHARGRLEQYRQCRLFDCPYKEPVAVPLLPDRSYKEPLILPLRVLEDARLPGVTRWEEVAELGLTLRGQVRQGSGSADSE